MTLLAQKQEVAVRIRRWPEQFRAALAVCNDIDCTRFDDFLAIHRFLNTDKPTPFGDGLSLPIGDSFWMYSVWPDHDPGFAYFEDLAGKPSPIAPRIREFIEAGVLDVLHTYGNFSQHGGFRRHHAERAADELTQWNLRPSVWVNHGDCHNFQNIHGSTTHEHFAGGRTFRCGADGVPVRNLEYHLDITHRLGVRYLWVHELTQDIGQDRPLSAREHLFQLNALKRRRWWRRDLSELSKAWIAPNGNSVRRGMRDNRLMRRHALEPGPFYAFRRFGKYGPDCMQHVPILLSDDILDALADSQGVTVLFAHLGKRPDPSGPVFDEAAAAAFRELARRYHSGELYVETTSRLLRYITIRDHLEYKVDQRNDHVVLNIERVNDPVLGTFTPTLDDLAGMSFDVRSDTPPIVTVKGAAVSRASVTPNDGGYRIQFPVRVLDTGDLLD